MKTFLSVDWDYFIDATSSERMALFPDGGSEDISAKLACLVWGIRYVSAVANSQKNVYRKISTIGVLEREYQLIKNYLEKQVGILDNLVVAESHASAYQLFSASLAKGEQCNIINIDYHSDLYKNIPGEVDCGNWLSEMLRKGMLNELTWVAREDSADLPREFRDCANITRTTDLVETLKSLKTIDGLFICRSGVWSPPHLDVDLLRLIQSFCGKFVMDISSIKSRYTPEFKAFVQQYSEQKLNFGRFRDTEGHAN